MVDRTLNRAAQPLGPDDCALVIIDVQEKLLPVMSEKEKVLENSVRLAGFAKIAEIPVLVTEQEKLGATVGELAEALGGFTPVSKIDFDACRVLEFNQRLEALGKKGIVIAGIESHVCITQTVLSLLPGYNVHLACDAVSSRSLENKEVALGRMWSAGAVLSSTEMFIYEILLRAGTPEFKETLKLVK